MWFHGGDCSNVPLNMLSVIEPHTGLLWLCPNSADQGKKKLKEDWKSINKIDEIVKKVA